MCLAGLCEALIELVPISGLLFQRCLFSQILIMLYFSRKFVHKCRAAAAGHSDKRVQAFSEFIRGCYVVKAYNWESLIEVRVGQLGANDSASIRYASQFQTLSRIQCFITSLLLASTTSASAWFLGYLLNATITFPTLLVMELI